VATEPALSDALHAAELKDAWDVLSVTERLEGLRLLGLDELEDLLLGVSAHEQMEILLAASRYEGRAWIRLLPPDDAADVVQEADPGDRPTLLDLLDDTGRKEVVGLLAYAEDDAGGLMNPRYARLRPEMRVDEAISYIRRQTRAQVETVYYLYVLDAQQRLLGVVSFRDLLMAPPERTVRDVMHTDVVTVHEEMDQEALSALFAEHDFLAVPVVDDAGRMKGIVTVDDIVDVVREEATEDLQKFGGMTALETPYLETPLRDMLRKRGGWLALLFVGELFTATAMAYFEHEIARAVVLALFIPLIISSGGNSGSQAASLIIRALAVGELRVNDWWRVMRREILAGLVLGGLLGFVGFLRITLWSLVSPVYGPHWPLVAATVWISLMGVVLWGTLTGSMLPLILKRLGMDPAVSSAPFVATLVDVTGIVIYFEVAARILRGTLL
jgi:magnesium transporter